MPNFSIEAECAVGCSWSLYGMVCFVAVGQNPVRVFVYQKS